MDTIHFSYADFYTKVRCFKSWKPNHYIPSEVIDLETEVKFRGIYN